MPAMHAKVLDAMECKLYRFRDRMIGQIPFDLTHEECIRLIAPSEHIAILTDAAKYADVSSREEWLGLSVPAECDGELNATVVLKMRTHAHKEPPLRPRSPCWQPGHRAGEKVIAWLTKRLELGRRFGLARCTLYKLSEICETGTEVRYLWPAVMHLCSGNASDTREGIWAAKHAMYKPVRYAPTVSPQLKKAIQDSSALITSAVLMGEDVGPPGHGEVQIDSWNLPTFLFDKIVMSRR